MTAYNGNSLTQLTGKQRRIIMASQTLSTTPLSSITYNNLSINGAQGASYTLSPAVTLQGFSNLTTNANDFVDINNPFVKKYEIYDLAEDVIALAVTQERNKGNGYIKLTDPNIFKKVTQEDRDKAIAIRNYYNKKFTYIGLTETHPHRSGYRQDLQKLLSSDGKKIQENLFGIAYWLPTFYEYDLQRDSIKQEVLTKGCDEVCNKFSTSTVSLTPLKRIRRKTKRTDFYEYWFKTSDNYGFLLPTKIDNNLLGFIEYFFNTNQSITLNGKMHTKTLDNFEYLSMHNWTLLKA